MKIIVADLNRKYEYWDKNNPNHSNMHNLGKEHFPDRTEVHEVVNLINSFDPIDKDEFEFIEESIHREIECKNMNELKFTIERKVQERRKAIKNL